MTPKGFGLDLEKIGAGKPVLVFVDDPNLIASMKQFEEMNTARGQIGDKALFFIASSGTPDGNFFISKYAAKPLELFLFDRSGKLLEKQFALKQSAELVKWLSEDGP